MEKFLKKFSDVPNEFLEDFFQIAKESYNDDEFTIDFSIVIKWFNTRKDHLKRFLFKYFLENHDYVIERIKKKNSIGNSTNYYDDIWITPDCFERLCTISQTSKAKEVRRYYLSIEKSIKKIS